MHPTRCLSSYLTTELLVYRNPQGSEENWFHGGDHIDNIAHYYGKVITTEIGMALLCITATVETVAYGILLAGIFPLFLISLPIRHLSKWPSECMDHCYTKITPLIKSSGFTIYWNLGNLMIFNFSCTNVFTDESLARYSMDHWPRGNAYKIALEIMYISLLILSIFTKSPSPSPDILRTLNGPSLRPEDIIYIAEW